MKIEKTKSQQIIPEHAKKVFTGAIFDVYQWEQEMFDGSKQIFEKLRRPYTVNVIAFTEEGKIIFLDQEQPSKGSFFSLPGGRVDEGESLEDAARRELLEETGYKCESISLWHSKQIVSKMDWIVYFFVAKGCKKVSEQNLDAGEKIKVKLVDIEEFIDMIFAEKIESAEFIMKLFKDELIVIDKEKTYEKIKNNFLQYE